jgi:hypothetical protein
MFPSTPLGQPALHTPHMNESSHVILTDPLLRHNFFTTTNGTPKSFFRLNHWYTSWSSPEEWVTWRQFLMDWSPRSVKGMWVWVSHPFHTYLRRMSFRKHLMQVPTPLRSPCPTRWSCMSQCGQSGLVSCFWFTTSKSSMPSGRNAPHSLWESMQGTWGVCPNVEETNEAQGRGREPPSIPHHFPRPSLEWWCCFEKYYHQIYCWSEEP